MYQKNSHCSFCGHPFASDATWPRTCPNCANLTYRNPLPVAVMLLPIATEQGTGLLTIRRAIQPRLGQLALPGGFIELRESWQQACVRELAEEAEITVNAAALQLFNVHCGLDGYLLVFGLAPTLVLADLPPFRPTPEVSERLIIYQPQELAFPLHTQVVAEFFARQ